MKFLQNLTVKQRQRLLLVGVGGLFLLLVVGGSYFTEKKKEERIEERKKATKKMSLLTDKVEKDLWIAAEGQNIKALEKSNEELRHRLEQLSKELDDTKRELKKKAEASSKMPPIPPPAPTAGPSPSGQPSSKKTGFQVQEPSELPPPEELSFPPDKLPFSPAKSPKGGQDRERERVKVEREKVSEKRVDPYSTIRIFKEEGRSEKKETEAKKPSRDVRRKKQDEEVFLPAGSFMKAVTISGIDAPTSGGSQSEPYPVLLGITDLSILPNRFKMNLKECFIIGAGYGNLSDERAYIRTETLSCVRSDGGVIDIPLKGHVIGEDGKLGMRGRLVSKQGQKIAMAIVTGTLASFGNAFKPQTASVLQLDPKQSGVFRYEIEDVLQAGALGGVGNALNKVADYYLRLAEKIFPIIEIDAGREVEVLVLKGQELKIGGQG